MKKILKLFLLLIAAFSIYSCNNTFSPNAPFRQRYALNGIMRSDTTLQIVTLTRSYEPADGFNPQTNHQDPAVTNAQVSMWYKDTLYRMRDTTIMRQDTSRYKDPVHCYYVNNLKPQENQFVDIEALLPSGILLKSSTKLPAVDPYYFFDQNNDKSIPPPDKDFVTVKWASLDNTIYSPKIYIIYYVKGSSQEKKWQVPLSYATENGKDTAIYAKQTKINFVNISMATIEKILNEIPQGGNKKDYTIAALNVELVVYDVNLSTYYLSLQTGLNEYTVRLDSPDYSDVQGGYGIFGSYFRTNYRIRFTYDYLRSLGFE